MEVFDRRLINERLEEDPNAVQSEQCKRAAYMANTFFSAKSNGDKHLDRIAAGVGWWKLLL